MAPDSASGSEVSLASSVNTLMSRALRPGLPRGVVLLGLSVGKARVPELVSLVEGHAAEHAERHDEGDQLM
jgi:hypothetical protein